MCRFIKVTTAWLIGAVFLNPLIAQDQKANNGLNALVEVLAQSDDPQFQYDILKGMSDGLKGRRGITMPAGWEDLAKKLAQSANPQVRELAQSLSLTFGSISALNQLRARLVDSSADTTSRKTALDALVETKNPSLPPILQKLLKDAAMRASALRALAAYDDAATPSAILSSAPPIFRWITRRWCKITVMRMPSPRVTNVAKPAPKNCARR